MDAVKYFEEKVRMLNSLGRTHGTCGGVACKDCPLSWGANGKELHCTALENIHPELAIEIVEKWSAENPQKTILQDFLGKYPNAPVYTEGQPRLCPQVLGYFEGGCTGDVSCKECWNRPLEG